MYLCEYIGCPSGSFNLSRYMLGHVLCIISFLHGLWKCMNKYWLGEKRIFCWLENKAKMLNPAANVYLPTMEWLSVHFGYMIRTWWWTFDFMNSYLRNPHTWKIQLLSTNLTGFEIHRNQYLLLLNVGVAFSSICEHLCACLWNSSRDKYYPLSAFPQKLSA